MMVIRAFNMQTFEENASTRPTVDLTAVSLFINRLMVVMMPMMMFIMNLVMVSVIWFGAQQVADLNMQVGDMIAFMQYGMQIMFAFLMMSMLFIILPRASVSADRVAEVLETEIHIHDPKDAEEFPRAISGQG